MNECVTCVNWNMTENSELMKYKPPENYLSTTYLKPKKLTFADYSQLSSFWQIILGASQTR